MAAWVSRVGLTRDTHGPTKGPIIARTSPKWTSTQFAYAALAANGSCLLVLLLNLVTGNAWWQVAVAIAVGCLVIGGVLGFRSRSLRIRERRGDF
ncbi:hypothetical protein HQQ80_20210 [Microbacteriaceae bacterium VKM Ac-2855]|nr:hypothetical protein [Microbacteriaceae bacterium VKM Ac-2855]